jgi:hypothetical protein
MPEERFIALLSQRAASQTRPLAADHAVPTRA